VWQGYFATLSGQQVASFLPVLLHPKSKGEILLRDGDPNSLPLINPRYLTDQRDVDTLYRGILLIKKLINTPAMQSLGASLNPNIMPGCEQFLFDSEDYWKCYIRHLTLTAYHPVGTCKMGPKSDPSSVVDFDLRVHNSHHLYVIDASIMPSLPSGNINAAVIMIAEKGAEIVERYWAHQAMVCHQREVFLPTKVSLKVP
ncbi:unnamed protein product, partial [Timema podura]|nr:unnamed protein product [Timema podura]